MNVASLLWPSLQTPGASNFIQRGRGREGEKGRVQEREFTHLLIVHGTKPFLGCLKRMKLLQTKPVLLLTLSHHPVTAMISCIGAYNTRHLQGESLSEFTEPRSPWSDCSAWATRKQKAHRFPGTSRLASPFFFHSRVTCPLWVHQERANDYE